MDFVALAKLFEALVPYLGPVGAGAVLFGAMAWGRISDRKLLRQAIDTINAMSNAQEERDKAAAIEAIRQEALERRQRVMAARIERIAIKLLGSDAAINGDLQ